GGHPDHAGRRGRDGRRRRARAAGGQGRGAGHRPDVRGALMTATEGELLDTLDMFGATMALPEQAAAAAQVVAGVEGLPSAGEVDNVVVLGMGGSGLAGDVLAAIAGPFVPVPIMVVKGYAAPSFVGPRTLCMATSFSGDTEETLESAAAAVAAGAHMVTMSSGGRLAELGRSWQAPHIPVPSDIPMPRAGIGATAMPLFGVLERVGLFPG